MHARKSLIYLWCRWLTACRSSTTRKIFVSCCLTLASVMSRVCRHYIAPVAGVGVNSHTLRCHEHVMCRKLSRQDLTVNSPLSSYMYAMRVHCARVNLFSVNNFPLCGWYVDDMLLAFQQLNMN